MSDTESPDTNTSNVHQLSTYRDPAASIVDRTLLDEAANIVDGKATQQYGHPAIFMDKVAAGWSILFEANVAPENVALAMVWFKICREMNKPKRDNIVDAIGYLLTYQAVKDKE